MNDQNLAMVVEYDGSRFFGFQKQNSGVRTIQNELEKALSKFVCEEITVTPAGRTDTGVHASFQVINFYTKINNRTNYNWLRGVNSFLPDDIAIRNVATVPPDFHSRFSARSRQYRYYLTTDKIRSVFSYKRYGWCPSNLDLTSMQEAVGYLLGKQDFSCFRATNCQAKSPIKHILAATIFPVDSMLCLEIRAESFLYHMVRNIMGALIYVGKGKLTANDFKELILQKNRTYAPPTFMPDGLYLTHVEYDKDYFYS